MKAHTLALPSKDEGGVLIKYRPVMPQNQTAMRITLDSLGRELRYAFPPQRIVSLCPSQTETLFALGLGNRIVGRTRYCIHPEVEVSRVADIGGTKQLRTEDIRALEPDLIIAEKEENRREDIGFLETNHPVYVTDVRNFDSALHMIRTLGSLCDCDTEAEQMANAIEQRWRALRPLPSPSRAAYLIWRKPWMAAGPDTYIHDVLTRCGFENVFAAGRYPETTLDEIERLAPEHILLSSEPYPFTEKHRREFAERLPRSKVLLVDGEAFSWYGAHMLEAADELQTIIDGLK